MLPPIAHIIENENHYHEVWIDGHLSFLAWSRYEAEAYCDSRGWKYD